MSCTFALLLKFIKIKISGMQIKAYEWDRINVMYINYIFGVVYCKNETYHWFSWSEEVRWWFELLLFVPVQ